MKDQNRELVLRVLGEIAPEADLENIKPEVSFRDQFDFDSVDCLNLVIRLQKELKFDIPEADYPMLATLNGCVEYLRSRKSP
jgi:acyl carrier protein